ncbi:MAG: glycoside hydrolase family 3 C-terminal domain-containing protein [Sphingomonas sp.]|nr:glycoside hydrolase family 3 N-terminal domain-containing protein [Sphingomonas sp.]MBV9528452.1 glycoside hydrolase family 3 C-terminal domain-containing protein [Sphingomonas sp.]
MTLESATAGAEWAQSPSRVPVYKDPRQPVDRRVDDLLARMTLDEKVAQLETIWEQKSKVQNPDGTFSPQAASQAFPNGIGGMARPSDKRGNTASNGAAGASATVNRDARDTARYVNEAQHWAVEHTRLGIPILMHEEALHGYVARGATSFPQAIALASTWDPQLVTNVFSVAAREMRARGAFLALAPVVDIARDPRWGRIEETYGEDPYLVGTIGLAAIRGFQGPTLPLGPDKVLVTLKHFTGHGEPENGTNVGPAHLGERELREDFFPPFERAVKVYPIRSLMASYNEIDGIPSHANSWLLNTVLRGEWSYQGAVVSDYYGIRELVVRHHLYDNVTDAADRAIQSGVDVETPDAEGYAQLPALVRSGRVPRALVDQAVRRVLRLKIESGLFDNPFPDPATAEAKTATPEAIALAREAADKAMVLLKNDHDILPLDPMKIHRMAVIGTHAKDTPIGGYSDIPRHVVSVLEGMQDAGHGHFAVDYSEGVRLTETRCWSCDEVKLVPASVNRRLIAQAVTNARKSDVIVMVLGDNEQTSREAWADTHLGDRSSLDLVGQQEDLARAILALHKPTVVVLLNGRPLSVNYLAAKAPALIEGWYLGQETGHAVADVVLGKVVPGGKLPVSIPRSVGQLPVYYDHKPTSRRGYLFDTTAPLYPFGYGLSYTHFDISAPRVLTPTIAANETARIDVDVANTGSRSGDEVVQLYVHDDEASVTRPVIALKRFQRVTLQPGERRTIRFTLDPDDLALWNANTKRVVEPGTFTISAGPNSVDLKSAKLTVAG